MSKQRNKTAVCPYCFAILHGETCEECGKTAQGASNPAPALQPGHTLGGRYHIGNRLGMGGFGITYLAWDLTDSKKVAVKEFYPQGFAQRQEDGVKVGVQTPEVVVPFYHWLRGFIEEGKILIRIKHLHGVVKLLDFFEENNTAYLVMDYLEGESLRSFLSARGNKLSAQDTLKVLRPVLESLAILHGYGVMHNDISPENIQVVKNKYVKLIDFGAATLYKTRAAGRPFAVLKAGYSPIELYKPNDYRQGPWTDVYQMGATVYNCMTGYVPAVATEREQEDKLPRPSSLGVAVSEQVENAVMRSLAIKPEDRFQTVGEFVRALGL